MIMCGWTLNLCTVFVKKQCPENLIVFFSVAKLKVFSQFLSQKKKGINIKFMQKNFKI